MIWLRRFRFVWSLFRQGYRADRTSDKPSEDARGDQ